MVGRQRRQDRPGLVEAARLGAAIRKARSDQGLSQEQVAFQAGVSVSTLRKIESSFTVDPSFFSVMAILTVLDLDPREFYPSL